MVPVIAGLIILLVCAFLIALPRKTKGCLVEVLRPALGLAGAALPVVVLWLSGAPDGIAGYAVAVAVFVLDLSAVTLAATGWQALLHERSREQLDEMMTDSLMNPFGMLEVPTGSSASSDDLIGGCLLFIVMVAANVLIVVGLLVANGFKQLLPAPGPGLRRAARVTLGLAYGLLVFAGGAALWLAVNG